MQGVSTPDPVLFKGQLYVHDRAFEELVHVIVEAGETKM